MRTAIVHYWMINMRGGEKVLEALCEAYPNADIFTHVYVPKEMSPIINSHRVHTTFISKLPRAARWYQKYFPLMPLALEELDLTEYDLVISSESGPAKGVITRPDATHICYCHSPMRYLWDQYHLYRTSAGIITRTAMPILAHFLRIWDVSTASRVDKFIVNSHSIKARVRKFYRRNSEVIHPPCDVGAFQLAPQNEVGEYYLAVGQLVAYKRFDIAVEAFNQSGKKLIVIGEGEERAKLEKTAKDNITFLGKAPFDLLKHHYARCAALIFPGEEDFGIVPVEAMASGRPVIAYERGGALDTVVQGVTGHFFKEQTPAALIKAVEEFEGQSDTYDPAQISATAQRYSRERFIESIKSSIETEIKSNRLRLGGQDDSE